MTKVKYWRLLTRADWVLAFVLAALTALSYGWAWNGSQEAGSQAVIFVGEKKVGVYPLDQPRTIKLQGTQGEATLEIKDGKIRMLSSPCRQHICLQMGWAGHNGELIACLPNKILVKVSGGPEPEQELDALAR